MRNFPALRILVTGWITCSLLLLTAPAYAETYWLDSRADPNQTHYPNGEEACLTGELQRRLDGYLATSNLPHRIISAYIGPDLGGERTCKGHLQKRQFNLWLPVEIVDTPVYGPFGTTPPCPLGGLADPETGQCGIPKCNDDCPADGGNKSNPVASATGNKREREADYHGAGVFPLEFVRYYNSHRVPDNRAQPIGVGWTHNYAAKVAPMLDGSAITRIRAYRPNGAIQTFTLVGGNWVGDADVPERLTATVSSGSLASATYRRADDTVEAYDQFGRLTSITSPEGFVQTLNYAAGSGSSSHVQRVTDPQGRTLTFGYSSGFLTTLTDNAGAVITFSYSAGDLVGATYPNALSGTDTRTYHYNESGQTGGVSQPHVLTGITDESSNRYASWGYDPNRRGVLSVHGPYATGTADRTELQFNPDGTATITDSLGQVRGYAFVASQRVARLTSLDAPCDGCANAAAARTYDANGYPASATDFEGNVTRYTYDARGLETERVEAATDATGNKRTMQTDWHATFRQPTEHRIYDAASTLVARKTLTHNSRGQILTRTRTDPVATVSRTVSTAYCEAGGVSAGTCPMIGLPISSDGPRTDVSDVTSYTYYQANHIGCASSPATCQYRKGDLWKVTDALGRATEFLRYDAIGRPLSMVNPNGVATDLEYHPRGWLTAVKVRGPDNSVETDDRITRMAHWPTGLVKRITQPDGAFTAYTYDAAHRLINIADNAGNTIHYTLDNAGNRIQENTEDASGALKRTLSRVYNQLGRLITSADADANPTDFGYDPNGNLDTVTDAFGRVTDSDYDPLNRLVRTLQDVGGIDAETDFEYDALDNLTKVTDPKGLDTSYAYNGLGDLMQVTSPDTGTTTYSHDSAGNRFSQTDARGNTVYYFSDALNRTDAIYYLPTGESILYGYDTASSAACMENERFAVGRLTWMSDSSGRTDYCYDRFGNLVRKRQRTNYYFFSVRYAYTNAGKISSITYPDGAVIDYVRDGQGRVIEVGVIPSGGVRQVLLNQVDHYPFGPAAGWTYGNGRSLLRTYNQNYQPLAVLDGDTDGLSLGYEFDAVGNLAQLNDGFHSAALARYDHDALNRLTDTRDGPTGTVIEQYGYDATGNRTSLTNAGGTVTYAYATDSHRLMEVGGISRSYDAIGNTTQIGAARQFVYDLPGRLTQVEVGGSVLMSYDYNGRGERVWRGNSAANVYTVYDEAGHWIGDYDSSGVAVQQAIWLDDLPVGLLVGAGSSQELHYVEPDHLGTPRVVIDPIRDVAVWKWDIKGEAFGNTVPDQDPDGDGTAFVFDMRFPGQRYDAISGLNYNYFRDYDPGTGRYVESDPIGLGGGPSTYGYVLNTPLGAVDPLGLQTTVDTWCRQHPVECAAIFGTGAAITVVPKPQTITLPETSSGEKCKTCAEIYPEYDECSEMSRYYPYASAAHALLDFPSGSRQRSGTPATSGLCAMKGTHRTVFLNGAYVGSVFSCRCCTNTGGGPVLGEIWGNNVGR